MGAGPGDPGLITVRGRDLLHQADVVIYDYLANQALLANAPDDAELIYAGKVGGRHNQDQESINRTIVEKASEGKRVVRLKGGDPFVFGRGGEECEALKAAGIDFEVVPGVTAAVGASAYAGIPLTHRDYAATVSFVTGQEGQEKNGPLIDWSSLSPGCGTIVFYMGVRNLRENMTRLVQSGWPVETPAALIRWGTTPRQETLTGTIADLPDKAEIVDFKPPAITIVGSVVSLRSRLRWFDARPLFGRTILVTRAADQAGEFSYMLEGMGANVIECPTIRISDPPDISDLDSAIADISSYQWIVLTSANAVHRFFSRLYENSLDSRALGSCRVCAVGPRTAEIVRTYGVCPDLVPSDYKAEGVVSEFSRINIEGAKILFPRADLAREVIPRELTAMGARVDAPVAYINEVPESLPEEAYTALEEGRVDVVTFTSSSTAKNLQQMLGTSFIRLLSAPLIASIGPVTSATCRELGLDVHIEPSRYTLASLTKAIALHFSDSNEHSRSDRL